MADHNIDYLHPQHKIQHQKSLVNLKHTDNMGYHHHCRPSIILAERVFPVFLTRRSFSRQSRHKNQEHHANFYRVAIPSPPQTLHEYCIAKDETYACLSARLKRMKDYKATVSRQLEDHGRTSGLKPVLAHLKEDVEKLERELDVMMDEILDGELGCGDDKKVFRADGRWVREL